MFSVYISAKSLENICLNEMSKDEQEQNKWFLVLSKQKTIYLDCNIYESLDYDDPLFIFSQGYQIDFKEADFDFNNIDTPSQEYLNHPQGAYLLDVLPEQANELQRRIGQIFESTDNLDKCPLTFDSTSFNLTKGENEHSWKELFSDKNKIPSNSLVIVDRYIFSFQRNYMSGYLDGLRNIKSILRSVLPKELSCDYQVLILFDEHKNIDRNYSCEKVISNLSAFIRNELKVSYNVNIELFTVNSNCENYDATHNRRIVSNYFIVKTDHLLKAFNRNKEAICDQDISLDYLYSKGLNGRSDCPEESISRLLSQLNGIYKAGLTSGSNDEAKYMLYNTKSAVESAPISDLSNRLLLWG